MATSNRMRRLNLLTLILLNKASKDKGLTIQEILDETQGDFTRTTLSRLLKEPGFMVANYPTWPRGYYFDPTEAVMGIPSSQDRIIKNQAINYASSVVVPESRFPNLPGKYSRDNPLGKYEDRPTNFINNETTKFMVYMMSLPDNLAAFNNAIENGKEALDRLKQRVADFKSNGTKIDLAACREDGEKLVKFRNAGFAIFEAMDIILADPILNTPEWWSVFDTEGEK